MHQHLQVCSAPYPVLSCSGSSSDSSREASPERKPEPERKAVEAVAPVVLTEQEMNQLGAKILKAELMGNEVSFSMPASQWNL